LKNYWDATAIMKTAFDDGKLEKKSTSGSSYFKFYAISLM